jgi:adenylate cyclase
MAEEGFKRKLAAILSADVEGYSRLMGEDEDATIRTLTAYRELMSTLIQKHRGRVVDSPGDNLLAEFLSVVDAVRCAVEIQEELRVRNAELPENRRMEFRIGINLGDVVQEEERIYGDGINIAARVEGIAEGGGICISGTVYDSIKNKLSLSYESLGEHTVKNIKEPVRVYRMRIGPEAAAPVIKEEKAGPRRWQKAALAAVVVLVVLAGAWAIWNFYFRPPAIEPAAIEKMAFPLPDKPSIAVLPFVNVGGDTKDEYFSDGITEQIITGLSKVPKMFVISRSSTFTYKGKPVKVKQVAEELGVRYVLEGSIQRSEDRVRITTQLIDATTGHHLWAERYDRDLEDIFALQDEITIQIITALQVKLTQGDRARIGYKITDNLEAYLKFLQAGEQIKKYNKESNALARKILEEVIAMDPALAEAYSLLGGTHFLDMIYGTSKSPKASMAKAIKLTKKAIALNDSLAGAHGFLGMLYANIGQYEEGIAQCEQAVVLHPSSSDAHRYLGSTLRYAGRWEEAVPFYEKAIRLNPFPMRTTLYQLGLAYSFSGQYEKGIAACEKAARGNPNDLLSHIALTVAYGLSARETKAREAAEAIMRIDPQFSLDKWSKSLRYKNQDDKDRFIGALRQAGLK